MALDFSNELLNKAAEGYGVRELLRDGRLYLYSGTSPGADAAPTGTLLVTYTLSGGTYTAPVQSQADITLSGGSGSVDTVTVGGGAFNLLGSAVSYTTSLANTTDLVAAAINATQNPWNITADSDGVDTITLSAPYWLGANADGLTVAATTTTLSASINGGSSATFGGAGSPTGGTTAVNGLNFQFPAVAGVLSKESTIWQGTAAATGTAGYFRFVSGGSSVDGVTGSDVRFDGSVGTSGADLNLSSTSIATSTIQTISGFDINVGQ